MSKNYFYLSLYIIFLIPCILIGQDKKNIAVLELRPAGISVDQAQILTDRLRSELFKTEKFIVLERDKMNEILEEQGFQLSGCTTNDCAIEIGKLIGVEQIITGDIGKLENLYTLNIRLIDVETGKILNVATEDCECSIKDVLKISIRNVCLKLLGQPTRDHSVTSSYNVNDMTYEPSGFSDKDVRYAISLHEKGRIEKSSELLKDIVKDKKNKTGQIEGLTAILYLSKSYEDMEEFVPQLSWSRRHAHINFIYLLSDIENSDTKERVNLVRFYYAKKLYRWYHPNYSADVLEDILDSTNDDWLIVETLYFRINNNLGDRENDVLRLEAYYPDHPYTQELINKTGKK